MLEPGQPIEGRRPDRFRPPHCPGRDCPDHRPTKRYRCSWIGSYLRQCDPHRAVPRYLCPTCGRRFSRQSFATSYYLKRPELLRPIAAGLIAGSAHRQIARSLGCAPSTVTRLAARLGRHALLVQAEALAELDSAVDEPFVFDHFETFVFSQDDRLGIGTPVGRRSEFVYGFDPAPHRRAGRRGTRRRPTRRPLPEPVERPYVQSTRRVRGLLGRLAAGRVRLISDDHPAYRAVTAGDPRIDHAIYANPPRGEGSDPGPRFERNRELRAVDQFHRLIRHSQAHHRRETIAFGRRSNAVLERMALMAVWRNLVKKVTERSDERETAAMRAGVASRVWSWGDVLARRRFPGRVRLPAGWMRIYRRGWITPAVGPNCAHDLRHAF
jgi:transposase-like protein